METTPKTDQDRAESMDANWWNTMGVLYRGRRLIVIVTGGMAVLSVVVSLLLPNWYKASSRLVLPDGGSGGISSALLGNLSSAAQSLLGSSGGDYVRYLAILNSRTVLSSIIDRFDLEEVYDTGDSDTSFEDALLSLQSNIDFVIDDEFDFLSIEVLDKDPARAAAMSNFFVHALDSVNNVLSAKSAGYFRAYVEARYQESEGEMAGLLDSLQSFQEKYGVFDLEAQTGAYFDQLAELRVNALRAQIQYETLKSQFGSANAQVRAYKDIFETSDRVYQEALAGREQVFPVATENAPEMIRSYLNITLDQTIQQRILELVAPMLEQARFEEQRQKEAVQVIDEAIAPVRKYKPKRSVIVIASTLSAFILSVLFVLLSNWWSHNYLYFSQRLNESIVKQSSHKE